MKKISIQGKIIRGTRGASGLGDNETFIGTIVKQKPYFKSAGVKRVGLWYEGTININIEPKKIKILKPDYIITAEWKPNIVETFWLVDIVFKHKEKCYPAYIYYPCTSSVKAHPDSIIELLAEKIEPLNYGDVATIEISHDSVIFAD